MPQSVVVVCAFGLLLLCYHLIFGRFFPNFQGKMGHDYSAVFPQLLNGYFWFKNNSLFDVPWFTPAFCGGQPYFADVQSGYYSLPQLLTLFFDPLTSIYISIITFAVLGFWGMYILLRQLFNLSNTIAFLGAALFMFNGFYAHRMLVGHFGFQGFMLIPWMVFLLLRSVTEQYFTRASLLNSLWIGLCLTYWLQSGLTSLIIPSSLAILAVVCLYFPSFTQWYHVFIRGLIASLIALALCISKLAAGFAFMAHFPRSHYLLPGFNNLFIELKILFITLFFSSADIDKIVFPNLSNMQWALTHHEWEWGVTFIPLLIILLSVGNKIWQCLFRSKTLFNKRQTTYWIALVLLSLILVLPLVINLYTPEWNAILKETPILKSSSTLTRWWLIYIPVIIVFTARTLENITFLTPYRKPFVVISVVLIIVLNVIQDRMYYHLQTYQPQTITQFYQKIEVNNSIPKIEHIAQEVRFVDEKDQHLLATLYGNDLIAVGGSQMSCYNPSFGYRLENLPLKSLHEGNVYEQTQGKFNLKNPACYVFPAENQCEIGDHFKVSEKAQVDAFVNYQAFAFNFSLKQKIANLITKISLCLISVFLGFSLIYFLKQKFFQPTGKL